jgi:TolA-binding protein
MKKRFQIAFCMIILALVCSVTHASNGDREYSRANELLSKGKYSEAIASYQSVLTDPSHSVSISTLHARIADSYFRLGDYRNARAAYRRALQEQKEFERPATQYWIAFSTFLMGKNNEAINEFLKIPELYPGSGMWVSTAYYWAGRVCERMGEKKLAADYFRKAGGNGKLAQERFALEKAEKNR